MEIVLLVDGYNVIHSSSKLKRLLKRSKYQAQERLVSLVSTYCSFQGIKGYVVFDAYKRPSLDSEEKISSELKVILTGKGKTADCYIERFVSQNKVHYDYIYVITSDYPQRRTVDDKKVLFLSSRNFLKETEACQKVVAESYLSSPPKSHLRVSDYLENEVKEKLQRMREELL